MGYLMDLFTGLVALIALSIGGIVARAISGAMIIPYFDLILAIIGLVIAGFGLKKRGLLGAVVTGGGLGVAIPLTTLMFR